MIRKKEFEKIQIIVRNAVNEAFEHARENEKNKNDYIHFLANSHYVSKLEGSDTNPYIIDYKIDHINDEARIQLLMEYINAGYSFFAENTVDSKTTISIELMIYTHMWEAKPYLKQLKKLADLCDSKDYDWNVEVPDYTKHKFIREEIRDVFKNHRLFIHEIITQGFHPSLRNAFAHSEYVFDINDPKLILKNYKGKSWELKEITFDQWTERFCYTFLLAYLFQEKLNIERKALNDGEPGYEVITKDKNGNAKRGKIIYYHENNRFSGTVYVDSAIP
jgi:hypothetical protein